MSTLITRREFVKGMAAGSCLIGLDQIDVSASFKASDRFLSESIHIVEMDSLTCLVGVGALGKEVCSRVVGMERQYGKVKPDWSVKHIPGYPHADLEGLEKYLKSKEWVWVVGSAYVNRFWSARGHTLFSESLAANPTLVMTVVPREWERMDEDLERENFGRIGVPNGLECWIPLPSSEFTGVASRLIMDIYASLVFRGPMCLDFPDLERVALNTHGHPLFFRCVSTGDLADLKGIIAEHSRAFSVVHGMFVVFCCEDLRLVEIEKFAEIIHFLAATPPSKARVYWAAISKSGMGHTLRCTILHTRSNGSTH